MCVVHATALFIAHAGNLARPAPSLGLQPPRLCGVLRQLALQPRMLIGQPRSLLLRPRLHVLPLVVAQERGYLQDGTQSLPLGICCRSHRSELGCCSLSGSGGGGAGFEGALQRCHAVLKLLHATLA